MGLFKFFRKKTQPEQTLRTPEDVVQDALAKQGIEVINTEIAEKIKSLWSSINFKTVFLRR